MIKVFPLVSVVLPTHNGGRFLRRSIDSCLNQTYKNIELIIVDDASDDNTVELITSYHDERIKTFRQDQNVGLPSALNIGFSKSRGDYLTWTSDDNYYKDHAIETMLKFLMRHQQYAFVYYDYFRINEKEQILNQQQVRAAKNLDYENCVGACFLYQRQVYEKVGDYNPQLRLVEDYEYWLRVRQHFPMKAIHQPLYYYRHHDASLTATWKTDQVENLIEKAQAPYISAAAKSYLRLKRVFSDDNYDEAKALVGDCLLKNLWKYEVWRIAALLYLPDSISSVLRQWKQRLFRKI